MDDEADVDVDLPTGDDEVDEDNEEVRRESYTKKIIPSIDAIHGPNILFQMTTSMNHPIMLIGLQKVYSKLAHSGEIFFYFVVPAQLYNSYKKQNFVTTNNVIAQRMPAWIKNRVKQYALKIDLIN